MGLARAAEYHGGMRLPRFQFRLRTLMIGVTLLAVACGYVNTGEPLYLVNRSGNRPSHENAAVYFDRAIAICRRAGFRRITLRGDTDFSQTEHLDRWNDAGVEFVFGFDATDKLYALAEKLPDSAWKLLRRPQPKTCGKPRERPPNVKERIVEERGYKNIRLKQEYVAEFSYRPTKCEKEYRMVVVWKDLEESDGQGQLFNKRRCFFYITNIQKVPAEKIVLKANGRCNQENVIEQLKNGVRGLTAPVDNLLSNWAYMVMASLAWTLKAWATAWPQHPAKRLDKPVQESELRSSHRV